MSYIKKSFSMLFCTALLTRAHVSASYDPYVAYEKPFSGGSSIKSVAASFLVGIPLLAFLRSCYTGPMPDSGIKYQKSPHGTAIAVTALTIFAGIKLGNYWYKNYYQIDQLSVKNVIASLQNHLEKVDEMIAALSSGSLEDSVTQIYTYFPHPYLTAHYTVSQAINSLSYYKKILERKMSQKKFSNTTLLEKLSNRIVMLEEIKLAILKKIQEEHLLNK